MTWTRKEICFVACRMLAIVLFVLAIRMTSYHLYAAIKNLNRSPGSNVAMTMVSFLLFMVPIVLIWTFSEPISEAMAGGLIVEREETGTPRSNTLRVPETKHLLHVAITVVGLLSMLEGVYGLVYQLFPAGFDPYSFLRRSLTDQSSATVVASLFLFVSGIILLFGGRSLANELLRGTDSDTGDMESSS